MKWLWWVVLLSACKRETAAPPAPVATPPVIGDAAVANAVATDAALPSDIELLRSVPSIVRVSSQVKNPKIKPAHLIDGDMSTAWNSVTGELVGAWVDISVDAPAVITQLRLTVGHTGKGPKAEDYFTMNPRIARVKVTRAGMPDAVIALDTERRDLQMIAVNAPNVRLTVAEVKPGSKKTWREVAISELEVWGRPPPDWKPPATPLSPDVLVGEPAADDEDPCAGLAERKAERQAARDASEEECNKRETQEERDQCNVDPPGDPDCEVDNIEVDQLAPPWTAATSICETSDDVYGPVSCTITAHTKDGSATVAEAQMPSARHDIEITDAVVADVLPGAPPEIVFRYKRADEEDIVQLVVCRAAPISCSTPHVLSGPGWNGDATFDKQGRAVIKATNGDAPPALVGAKPLVFK